jgi:hyperosmotically inducible protein
MKLSFLKASAFLIVLAGSAAWADDAAVKTDAPSVDNTAVNKRDQNDASLTPMDQAKGSSRDVELTRKIRQMIIKDKVMSSDAKNVKIITLAGKTTLRGPVDSMEEKNRIAAHAAKVLGNATRVDNQLEVKTAHE